MQQLRCVFFRRLLKKPCADLGAFQTDVPKLDSKDAFREGLPQLRDDEAALVLSVLCLSIVITGGASARGLRLYRAALEDLRIGDATFPDHTTALKDISLEFRDLGIPLSSVAIIEAVGERHGRNDVVTPLTVWVNGVRRGVMVCPGMTSTYGGRPVARLEGPLCWVVDMHDSSVAIAGPLPPPA